MRASLLFLSYSVESSNNWFTKSEEDVLDVDSVNFFNVELYINLLVLYRYDSYPSKLEYISSICFLLFSIFL